MIKNMPLKKIGFGLILLMIMYHVIFGGIRIIIDFKYPNGWYDNTIVAFGEKLRVLVFENQKNLKIWDKLHIQKKQEHL